jgi:hypothetical protein
MILRSLPLLFCTTALINAAPVTYVGIFMPVNGSSVAGQVTLTLDGTSLTVRIVASGLEPDQIHPQHIHGRVDASGNPLPPLPPVDLDGDGFIETPEAEQFIGPPLLPLAPFPTATGGVVDWTNTYDISGIPSLLPLNTRVVELHGMTVGAQGVGTPHEVNGVPGYKSMLPVASAMPTEIPEPSTVVLCAFGLGLVLLRRRRRTA